MEVGSLQFGVPTPSSRFQDLLLQLQQEHDRAVAAARTEAMEQKFPDIVQLPAFSRQGSGTEIVKLKEDIPAMPPLPGSVIHSEEAPMIPLTSDEIEPLPNLRSAGLSEQNSLPYPAPPIDSIDEVWKVGKMERYSKLQLTIIGSRQLPAMDWGGLSDPFCWCEVVQRPTGTNCISCGQRGAPCTLNKEAGKEKEKTECHYGETYCFKTNDVGQTLDPDWHHEAELDYPEGSSIRFVVYDKDSFSNEYIGEVTLESKDFRPDGFKGCLSLNLSKCSKFKESQHLESSILVRIAAQPRRPSRNKHLGINFSLRDSLDFQGAAGASIAKSILGSGSNGKPRPSMAATGADLPRRNSRVHKRFLLPRSLVVSPNSRARVVWDVSGLLLVLYDLITIPLQAFEDPPNAFTELMDWVTLIFWTCDLFSSWFLGYTDARGELEMRHAHVIKHYIKTWLGIDLIIVLPDWVITVGSGGATGDTMVGMGRLFRGFRALRVLRLMRLLKLKRILNILYDYIASEYMMLTMNIIKHLLWLATINHVTACVWYFIGNMTRKAGEPNWIDQVSPDFYHDGLGYKYLTSAHWSLTQFTPASIPISPHNILERFYAVFVLFFAMVCFSTLVGSVTSSMTQMRSINGDSAKQFWLLRTYFRQKNISFDLSQRIQRFLEHRCTAQQKLVQASSIMLLPMLSEQLQNELDNEVNVPSLMGHMYFQYLKDPSNNMKTWMDRLCHTALRQKAFAERDVVFQAGDTGLLMRFVRSGTLHYELHADRNVVYESLPPTPLTYQKWISEPVLWTSAWNHVGDLSAIEPCVLVDLSPDTFLNVMRSHPRPWRFATKYAQQYVDYLNRCRVQDLTDVILLRSFFDRIIERSLDEFDDFNETSHRYIS